MNIYIKKTHKSIMKRNKEAEQTLAVTSTYNVKVAATYRQTSQKVELIAMFAMFANVQSN